MTPQERQVLVHTPVRCLGSVVPSAKSWGGNRPSCRYARAYDQDVSDVPDPDLTDVRDKVRGRVDPRTGAHQRKVWS